MSTPYNPSLGRTTVPFQIWHDSPLFAKLAARDENLEPNDESLTHQLPGRVEICGTCSGRGQHSLRIGGITGQEWRDDWDEDSRELYLSGGMDEQCDSCEGSGRVVVVDRDRVETDILAEYDRQVQEEAEDLAMQRAEMRAEMGMAYYHG
jgi:hypothetical protein